MGWIKAGSNSITNTPTGSATFSDDFDTDDWDNMSSRINVNTTTEKLDFAMYRDGDNDSAVYDLGAGNVSDTAWILRWKMNFTAVYASGNGNRLWFGLSSLPQTTNQATAQDSIMMYQNHDGTDCFSASYSNDASLPQTNTKNPDYATGTDYYCELKRTSSTTIESRMWTGGYNGTLLSSAEDSVSNSAIGSVTGLRYIKMSNIFASQGGSVITGTIDDVEFWNNQTAGAEDDLDITSFTANETNQFLGYIVNSGDANNYTSFNDVSTGGKYSRAKSTNGGADSSSGMQNQNTINNTYQTTADHFYVIYGMDISGEDKLFYEHMVDQGSSTGAVQPNWIDYVFKMENNGTTRVTRIDFNNTSTGDYVTGSNLTVLNNGGTEGVTVQDGAIYYDTTLNKEFILSNNTWTEL